jgi:hypothetical protein
MLTRKHKYCSCTLMANGPRKEIEMSDKTLAIAFLLGTACLAIIATIMFPELPGLP